MLSCTGLREEIISVRAEKTSQDLGLAGDFLILESETCLIGCTDPTLSCNTGISITRTEADPKPLPAYSHRPLCTMIAVRLIGKVVYIIMEISNATHVSGSSQPVDRIPGFYNHLQRSSATNKSLDPFNQDTQNRTIYLSHHILWTQCPQNHRYISLDS